MATTRSKKARRHITSAEARVIADLFALLGNDTRLLLIDELDRYREVSVGDLARALGASLPATSNVVRALERGGTLASRRDGLRRFYRIRDRRIVQLLRFGVNVVTGRK